MNHTAATNYFDLKEENCSHLSIFEEKQFVWEVLKAIPFYVEKYIGKIDNSNPIIKKQQLVAHASNSRVFCAKHSKVHELSFLEGHVIVLDHAKIHPFARIGNNVVIGKNCQIHSGAFIGNNVIIGDNCEIRSGAYLRENLIIGDRVVLGNSTEVKNSLIFNDVEIPHFNYVGDSILGWKAHLGAGVKISNLKVTRQPITIRDGDKEYKTGLIKFGAIVGDKVEIGCNSVLNPGTMIGKNSLAYSNLALRGLYPSNSIIKLKQEMEVIAKK